MWRASTSSRISSASALLLRTDFRWAVGGWTFFIAENAILSENRTPLIAYFGDGTYHTLYGLCSTLATASIAYAYFHLKKQLPKSSSLVLAPSASHLVASWTSLTLGLCLASQTLPKMQSPVDAKLQVRCPFDFTDKRSSADSSLQGMERITRHPGLWSLALISAGQALYVAPPLSWWWWGPTAVAWLGGWHNDSRFRRGLGGTLDPMYDSQTSNLPFLALLSGKQGRVDQALIELLGDIKPLNAAIAVAAVLFLRANIRSR